jgi:hypothetical protein
MPMLSKPDEFVKVVRQFAGESVGVVGVGGPVGPGERLRERDLGIREG